MSETTSTALTASSANQTSVVPFGRDKAVAALTASASELSSEERARLTPDRVKALLKFAGTGLVRSQADYQKVITLYTVHEASPSKISSLLKREDFTVSTVLSIYETREELEARGITAIADLVSGYGEGMLSPDVVGTVRTRVDQEASRLQARPEGYSEERCRSWALRSIVDRALEMDSETGTSYLTNPDAVLYHGMVLDQAALQAADITEAMPRQ